LKIAVSELFNQRCLLLKAEFYCRWIFSCCEGQGQHFSIC